MYFADILNDQIIDKFNKEYIFLIDNKNQIQ